MTETIATEVFIPIVPDSKHRTAILSNEALPGVILAISAVGANPETIGALLLTVFCVVSGLLVVFLAIRKYRFPEKFKRPGTDTVAVFSGLLLIAQGSLIFNALKGFQPAHLYFIAAALFIFKGVMFPEGKIKKGFLIREKEIIFSSSPFRSQVKLPRINLTGIYISGNTMNFRYADNTIKSVKVRGADNLEKTMVALKQELIITD